MCMCTIIITMLEGVPLKKEPLIVFFLFFLVLSAGSVFQSGSILQGTHNYLRKGQGQGVGGGGGGGGAKSMYVVAEFSELQCSKVNNFDEFWESEQQQRTWIFAEESCDGTVINYWTNNKPLKALANIITVT